MLRAVFARRLPREGASAPGELPRVVSRRGLLPGKASRRGENSQGKASRGGANSRRWRLAVGQLPGKVPLDPLPDAHPPTRSSNGPTGKWLGGVAARSSAGTRTTRAATLRATDEHLSALHKLASARASRQDYSCTLSASERLTLRMARMCKHATTKYVRNPMPTSRAIRLIGSSITKLPE